MVKYQQQQHMVRLSIVLTVLVVALLVVEFGGSVSAHRNANDVVSRRRDDGMDGRIVSNSVHQFLVRRVPKSQSMKAFVDTCGDGIVQMCRNMLLSKDLAQQNGFYYGLGQDMLCDLTSPTSASPKENKRRRNTNVVLAETIEDLRESLLELREELRLLREFQREILLDEREGGKDERNPMLKVNKRRNRFDKMAKSVEVWAEKLLFEEDEDHGWSIVNCNKMFKKTFNPDDTISCFLKWMPDSREEGEEVKSLQEGDCPCLKIYATLDASFEQVCHFLSMEENLSVYNDLVVKARDVEEIDSHSKICWGQSPQILFVKPRDFVTFCAHRWKKDGSQVIVNQAVDHEDLPGTHSEKGGKACRAYALKGANFIWRDPEDSNKTKFAMLAHAHPGGGLPQWAVRSAINALAPIEPFKLFHKIEKGAQMVQPPPPTMFTSSSKGTSSRPGGMSQMGYACFWPNGGGLSEEDINKKETENEIPDGEESISTGPVEPAEQQQTNVEE